MNLCTDCDGKTICLDAVLEISPLQTPYGKDSILSSTVVEVTMIGGMTKLVLSRSRVQRLLSETHEEREILNTEVKDIGIRERQLLIDAWEAIDPKIFHVRTVKGANIPPVDERMFEKWDKENLIPRNDSNLEKVHASVLRLFRIVISTRGEIISKVEYGTSEAAKRFYPDSIGYSGFDFEEEEEDMCHWTGWSKSFEEALTIAKGFWERDKNRIVAAHSKAKKAKQSEEDEQDVSFRANDNTNL